jgi:hypothetical protein
MFARWHYFPVFCTEYSFSLKTPAFGWVLLHLWLVFKCPKRLVTQPPPPPPQCPLRRAVSTKMSGVQRCCWVGANSHGGQVCILDWLPVMTQGLVLMVRMGERACRCRGWPKTCLPSSLRQPSRSTRFVVWLNSKQILSAIKHDAT